jgi:hypothetical protein
MAYRATLDSTKDLLIKKMTTAISKIEHEGCEVLAHVVKQNEQIKTLRGRIGEEESDKVFLFSKAKEQLKLANDYKQVIKKQLKEIKLLNGKNTELLEYIKELKV